MERDRCGIEPRKIECFPRPSVFPYTKAVYAPSVAETMTMAPTAGAGSSCDRAICRRLRDGLSRKRTMRGG